MDADIRIQSVGLPHRHLVTEMYDRFYPLGGALGLPPVKTEVRREWIGRALSQALNLAAFSPAGEIVGHCFLVTDDSGSAEMALFVHQQFRRRGIGRALLKAALNWAAAVGVGRVWSLTSSDNKPALRLQLNCGFRRRNAAFGETELEIDLPVSRAA
jgi:GNAT superfamily N-acetyltransferase